MDLTVRHLTVSATERVVERRDGVVVAVLEPGRHRRRRRCTYEPVSMRERIDTTAPQEVLTSDGVAVRVTAAVRWAVGDPQAYLEGALVPFEQVYLAVQLALRDGLSRLEVDAVIAGVRDAALGEALLAATRGVAEPLGIEVRGVLVKDVVLPPELRSAYAELVTARARGQAQLEAARAETAALRSWANGAKLLDDHPALARLQLVQALPPGSTVELGELREGR